MWIWKNLLKKHYLWKQITSLENKIKIWKENRVLVKKVENSNISTPTSTDSQRESILKWLSQWKGRAREICLFLQKNWHSRIQKNWTPKFHSRTQKGIGHLNFLLGPLTLFAMFFRERGTCNMSVFLLLVFYGFLCFQSPPLREWY